MDKVGTFFAKVARAGMSWRTMRRAVGSIGALTAALVIGLAGTDAAQAVSTGPDGTIVSSTARLHVPGAGDCPLRLHPAHWGPVLLPGQALDVQLLDRSVGPRRNGCRPELDVIGPTIDYELDSVPSGVYYLVTEWQQSQGNSWSPSKRDKVDQVQNWLPNGWSQNTRQPLRSVNYASSELQRAGSRHLLPARCPVRASVHCGGQK